MKDDQLIRTVGVVCLSGVLGTRLAVIGNGPIPFFGFEVTPFGLTVIAVIVLALPETIDMLPFGPSRSDQDGNQQRKDEE